MSSHESYGPEAYPHEPFEEWTLLDIYRSTSAARPPVLNDANRSCAETAQHSNGIIEQLPEPLLEEHELPEFDYDNTRRLWNYLQSCSSSAVSSYDPEGPEQPEPDLHVASFYLPLAPGPGLGEDRHRRTVSFESNMSYQMRTYLLAPEVDKIVQETAQPEIKNQFLPQAICVQPSASKEVNKGSTRSKPSYVTDSSGDASFLSWGIDPVTGNGAWLDEDGNVYPADYYPTTLSWTSEST
jgi:hypothetical protein